MREGGRQNELIRDREGKGGEEWRERREKQKREKRGREGVRVKGSARSAGIKGGHVPTVKGRRAHV